MQTILHLLLDYYLLEIILRDIKYPNAPDNLPVFENLMPYRNIEFITKMMIPWF